MPSEPPVTSRAAIKVRRTTWLSAKVTSAGSEDNVYSQFPDSYLIKNAPFECGSESSGGRHLKLSVKFYLTAILFVVFDIESVFVYPWAIHFRNLGWPGFAEMLSFLAVIVVALVYVWRKGALEWET